MGRRKISIAPISDDRNRSVTFLKRKNGLFKKAYELGILCSADVAVIVFNGPGKLFEFASGDIDQVLLKYSHYNGPPHERRGPEDYASSDVASIEKKGLGGKMTTLSDNDVGPGRAGSDDGSDEEAVEEEGGEEEDGSEDSGKKGKKGKAKKKGKKVAVPRGGSSGISRNDSPNPYYDPSSSFAQSRQHPAPPHMQQPLMQQPHNPYQYPPLNLGNGAPYNPYLPPLPLSSNFLPPHHQQHQPPPQWSYPLPGGMSPKANGTNGSGPSSRPHPLASLGGQQQLHYQSQQQQHQLQQQQQQMHMQNQHPHPSLMNPSSWAFVPHPHSQQPPVPWSMPPPQYPPFGVPGGPGGGGGGMEGYPSRSDSRGSAAAEGERKVPRLSVDTGTAEEDASRDFKRRKTSNPQTTSPNPTDSQSPSPTIPKSPSSALPTQFAADLLPSPSTFLSQQEMIYSAASTPFGGLRSAGEGGGAERFFSWPKAGTSNDEGGGESRGPAPKLSEGEAGALFRRREEDEREEEGEDVKREGEGGGEGV